MKGGVIVFTSTVPTLLPDTHESDVRFGRAFGALRMFACEAACAVRGHDYLLHASGNRIFLRCADCEHETPGWRIDTKLSHRRGREGGDRMRTAERE